MASSHLPNYLRTNRMRLGLSQDEIAYLLGTESGTKVSRYEQFARDPGLRTVLAYEAIFQRPIRELFAGLYDEVEREVSSRAKRLILKTDHIKPGERTAHKRQAFTQIAGTKPKNDNP